MLGAEAHWVASIYFHAERALLRRAAQEARFLVDGVTDETLVKARQLAQYEQYAGQVLTTAHRQVVQDMHALIEQAVNEGRAAAALDLRSLGYPARIMPDQARIIELIVRDLTATLDALPSRALRSAVDGFQRIQAIASGQVALGALTRIQASQYALDELVRRGITGFTDKAGRNWSADTYTEMSVRTGAMNAQIEARLDTYTSNDMDLVLVSDSPRECDLCLIPGTVVEGPLPTGRTRSEYTGDIVSIVTASGKDLTGTPDHPVLTSQGWVPLKELKVGDKVVSHDREQGIPGVMPDDIQVPALIEEAGESWLPVLLAGPTRRDFDKGISYRKVRYVPADLELSGEFDATLSEPVADHLLVDGIGKPLSGFGAGDRLLGAVAFDSAGVSGVHGGNPSGALLGGGSIPPLAQAPAGSFGPLFGCRLPHVGGDAVVSRSSLDSRSSHIVRDGTIGESVLSSESAHVLPSNVALNKGSSFCGAELRDNGGAHGDAVVGEDPLEAGVADVEGGHELLRRLSGSVALDEVVDVSVGHYSGHVWDLSTEPAWFVANGIVTHNCRPWEGRILSLNGTPGRRTVESVTTGRPVTVDVTATVEQARSEGLLHPNCSHGLNAYLPGATRTDYPKFDEPDEYANTQTQRYYERQARHWMRRQDAATTPEAKKYANQKADYWQSRIDQLVKSNPGLRRRPEREDPFTAR